jgi:class 3 adenylate cyclase
MPSYFDEWREQVERVREMTESPQMRALLAQREQIERIAADLRAQTQLPPAIVEQQRQIQKILDDINAATRLPESLANQYPRPALPTTVVGSSTFVPRSDREAQLEKETADLKNEIRELHRVLAAEIRSGQGREETLAKLRATGEDFEHKQKLTYIAARLRDDAAQVFLASRDYQDQFFSHDDRRTYVMSIDLRRSTDLMLKAREARLFAEFIIGLSTGLRDVVFAHHGIFDKFTGDGILAYFPEFHTGDDAGYHAVAAAIESHERFADHYRQYRSSFDVVLSLRNVGLGIGIDYGDVQFVDAGPDLTIVGKPVVYACRLAATRAGTTLLNQRAYEMVVERWSDAYVLREDEIEIKNEGWVVAYQASFNQHRPRMPTGEPGWTKYETSKLDETHHPAAGAPTTEA